MEKLPEIIHQSWHPHLSDIFQIEEINYIKYQLLPKTNFLPESQNIFRVFSMPLQDIKIVILGQDPYPNKGVPIGYAFAVAENIKKPVSLRIIEKEVGHEIDKTLKHWIDQGVFLLNTALTVEVGKPDSHSAFWRPFTTHVLKVISSTIDPVWMLWGLNAIKYEKLISNNSPAGSYILKTPHPASEAYQGGRAGFLGSNVFTKANNILNKQNKSLINW